MADFDKAARFAAKLDPANFLRWLLPGLDADLLFTRWLETQTIPFPGQPDRRCDTVAELTHASGLAPSWMLVLEFQTEPDADIVEPTLWNGCWNTWPEPAENCAMDRTDETSIWPLSP